MSRTRALLMASVVAVPLLAQAPTPEAAVGGLVWRVASSERREELDQLRRPLCAEIQLEALVAAIDDLDLGREPAVMMEPAPHRRENVRNVSLFVCTRGSRPLTRRVQAPQAEPTPRNGGRN